MLGGGGEGRWGVFLLGVGGLGGGFCTETVGRLLPATLGRLEDLLRSATEGAETVPAFASTDCGRFIPEAETMKLPSELSSGSRIANYRQFQFACAAGL